MLIFCLFVFDYNLFLESNFFGETLRSAMEDGGFSVGSSRNCGLQVVEVPKFTLISELMEKIAPFAKFGFVCQKSGHTILEKCPGCE